MQECGNSILLSTYCSWPFIDIDITSNLKVFIRNINIFMRLSEWGGGPTFVTSQAAGGSISHNTGTKLTSILL
jgi:hypothetical protein